MFGRPPSRDRASLPGFGLQVSRISETQAAGQPGAPGQSPAARVVIVASQVKATTPRRHHSGPTAPRDTGPPPGTAAGSSVAAGRVSQVVDVARVTSRNRAPQYWADPHSSFRAPRPPFPCQQIVIAAAVDTSHSPPDDVLRRLTNGIASQNVLDTASRRSARGALAKEFLDDCWRSALAAFWASYHLQPQKFQDAIRTPSPSPLKTPQSVPPCRANNSPVRAGDNRPPVAL